MLRIALPLVLLLAACGGGDKPAAAGSGGKKTFRVAVIPKGTSHEFWKAVEQGARAADQELDDLVVVWKGPQGEGDANQQIQIVESFIAEGYDGICLAPLDARALETPVKAAVQKGIPVVIYDSGLASPDAPIVSYVATDNRHGGVLAGEEMARLLAARDGGKGNVIVMRYAIGSESTEQREAGFLEAIAKHPEITVLSSDKHGGPDETHAVEVGENLLATFGDKVHGIFCSNESSVSGLLTVLRRDQRGLAGKVFLVGFDSSANIVNGLRDGVLHATVLQDPVTMGRKAVLAMHDKLTGRRVAARIETGETLATKANMDEPRVHALLFPGDKPAGGK